MLTIQYALKDCSVSDWQQDLKRIMLDDTQWALSDLFAWIGVCVCVCVHICIGLHISEINHTCELFLRLYRVCLSEQSHSLWDATRALDLLLVTVVFKGQGTQGRRGCLVDLWTGAAQQIHQGLDPIELQHLQNKRASGAQWQSKW